MLFKSTADTTNIVVARTTSGTDNIVGAVLAVNIGMSIKQQKPKRAQYEFLPKRKKDFVDRVDVDVMLLALKDGCYNEFNDIVGIIQNLKDVYGAQAISVDHERILKLAMNLYNIVHKRVEAGEL